MMLKTFILATLLTCGAFPQLWPTQPPRPKGSAPNVRFQNQQMPPSVAYDYSRKPFDLAAKAGELTANELYALRVTIARAHEECLKLKPSEYTGDELYYLGKLCALGRDYAQASEALSKYLQLPGEPYLEQASSLIIDCYLRLDEFDRAGEIVSEMQKQFPYDPTVHDAVQEAAETISVEKPTVALHLVQQTFPALIAAIQQGQRQSSQGQETEMAASWFHDGLQLAMEFRLMGLRKTFDASVTQLFHALPPDTQLDQEERMSIQLSTRRFHLLDQHVLPLLIRGFYTDGIFKHATEINTGDGLDVFVFFPSWCPQCVHLLQSLRSLSTELKGRGAHVYGIMTPLLLGDASDSELRKLESDLSTHFSKVRDLPPIALGSDSLLQTFGIDALPAVLAVDKAGVVQYLDSIPNTALPGSEFISGVLAGLTAPGRQQ